MNVQRHNRNLEAIRANADVIGELATTMDAALAADGSAFETQGGFSIHDFESLEDGYGYWRQTVGQENQYARHFAETRTFDLFREVNKAQTVHVQAMGKSPSGITWHTEADLAVAEARSDIGDRVTVHRFGMHGMDTSTGHTDARYYQAEVWAPKDEEPQAELFLVFLGNTAVKAEAVVVSPEKAFAQYCVQTFHNRNIVYDALQGKFGDKEELDTRLKKLSSGSEGLLEELRTKALAVHSGSEPAPDFNREMPYRDRLVHILHKLREVL